MICRLTNGPVIAEGEDRFDIVQAYRTNPAPYLRMAPVAGPSRWVRLDEDSPHFEGEVAYELGTTRPVPEDGGEQAFLYVLAQDGVPIPDAEWQGKGGAARQKMRIVRPEQHGAVVVIERTAGVDAEFLGRPLRVDLEQLRAAFEPTGEFVEPSKVAGIGAGPGEAPTPEADAAGGPGSRVERQAQAEPPDVTA